jgi:hypothetical protein
VLLAAAQHHLRATWLLGDNERLRHATWLDTTLQWPLSLIFPTFLDKQLNRSVNFPRAPRYGFALHLLACNEQLGRRKIDFRRLIGMAACIIISRQSFHPSLFLSTSLSFFGPPRIQGHRATTNKVALLALLELVLRCSDRRRRRITASSSDCCNFNLVRVAASTHDVTQHLLLQVCPAFTNDVSGRPGFRLNTLCNIDFAP